MGVTVRLSSIEARYSVNTRFDEPSSRVGVAQHLDKGLPGDHISVFAVLGTFKGQITGSRKKPSEGRFGHFIVWITFRVPCPSRRFAGEPLCVSGRASPIILSAVNRSLDLRE